MWKSIKSKLFRGFIYTLLFMVLYSGYPMERVFQLLEEGHIVDQSVLSESFRFVNDTFGLPEAKAAADARSRTVAFHISTFASNGGNTKKNTATQQTLPDGTDFPFKLAEASTTITNAFIDFTLHWNATTTVQAVTSLFMAFDACVASCAANAWTGTGIANATYTTDFLGNTGEENLTSFKLDVTAEAQLAAYKGHNVGLEGQFGYCLSITTTCSSTASIQNISYATAILYITYTYDDTSPSWTNTVIYPLESASSSHRGSRASSTATGCTLGTNCPKFNFNMEIPEAVATTSVWFALNGSYDSAAVTDVTMTARIGSNATQTQMFDETLSSNDYGFPFYYGAFAGFANNTTSTLERQNTSATTYTMGGEVWETYTASSSAATKTRTIRFPLGEICTASVTSTPCAATTTVSFAETGVVVKKAWTRINYSIGSTGAVTNTISTKVGGNATTSMVYQLNPAGLGIASFDNIYDIIPSSTYATLASSTAASSSLITITTQTSASRGGTSGELLITYTYTGESGGYNNAQVLYGGQSSTDRNKASSTMSSNEIDPAIPETSGVTLLEAGLYAVHGQMESDTAAVADHGGTVGGSVKSVGVNLSTAACTAATSTFVDAFTENSSVGFYKKVSSIISSSTSATYRTCFSNNSFALDTTSGFQASALLAFTYQYEVPPPPTPTFTQNVYGWFANADSVQPGAALAAENTGYTTTTLGSPRLRMSLTVSSTALTTSSQAFKLQFTTSSPIGATWTDVPTSGGSYINFKANGTPADDAAITSTLLTSSDAKESYQEDNPTDANPVAVSVGQDMEWDFALDIATTTPANYYFRMVTDSGTVLGTYTRYPSLNVSVPALSGYRWFSNSNATSTGGVLAATNTVATAPAQGTPFRLRATLHASRTIASTTAESYKLQAAVKSGTCDTAFSGETYSDVATSTGAIRFYDNAGAGIVDGAIIVASTSDPSHGADVVVAQTYEEQNSFSATSTVVSGGDGLWDFALVDNSAASSSSYCFRVIDVNGATSTPLVVPEITTDAGVTQITVSGAIYSNEGLSMTTSTVKLAVGSSTSYSTSTASNGTFTFTNVTQPVTSTVLTVWMDNAGAGNGSGATVTRYVGSGNVTGLDVYKNYLITRHEDSGPIINTDLSLCDKTTGSACADADLHFEVTTSTSALTVDNDWGLYLWGGDTFTPGGAVTLLNGASSTQSAAYVQSATEYTTDGVLAYSSNVKAGNLLIAVISGSGDATSTISDTASSTWTRLPKLNGGGSGTAVVLQLFYAISASTSANTVTFGTLPSDPGMAIYEYSGIDPHSPLDTYTTKTPGLGDPATTTPTTDSFTMGTKDMLFLAFADESTNNTFTAGSGFTLRENQPTHVDAQQEAVDIAPGTTTASITLGTGAQFWEIYVAAFESAQNPGGDIVWASSSATFTPASNAVSIGGDWRNGAGGTYTYNSASALTFTATTTGYTINSGGSGYIRNATFNGSGGGWSAYANSVIFGYLERAAGNGITLTAGTLNDDYGSSTITVLDGDAVGTDGIIDFSSTTFIMHLSATSSANFGATNAAWTFSDLNFTDSSSTASTFRFSTQTSGTGNIGVTKNLSFNSSPTAGNTLALNLGNRTWTLSGTDGTPVNITASGGSVSVEPGSSTVLYNGDNPSGNTTIASTTYFTLSVGGTDGYFLAASTTVNGTTTIASNSTFDLNGANLSTDRFVNLGTFQGNGDVLATGFVQNTGSASLNLTSPSTFEQRVSTTTQFTVAPTAGYTGASFYNLKFNNSSTSSQIVRWTTAIPNSGFTVGNNLTVGDNSSSTVIFTTVSNSPVSSTINLSGTTPAAFTIGSMGQVNAGTSTIRINGDITFIGTFNPSTSLVYFDAATATSTITGSSTQELTFYNFKTDVANKPLVFATSTQSVRVNGILTLRGTASNTPVFVQSNSSGTQWNINHQGTEDVEFISLKDSGCVSTSTNITITNATSTSIDRGNNDNPCWLISDAVASSGITVSGTVYSDEGVTTATSAVKLAVGSSTSYTTSTNGSGAFTFTNVTTPTSGDILTIWMDNNGGGNGLGATISRATSTGNITSLDIYKNHLIVRHEDNGPLTNTNMSLCDKTTGSVCADSDLHFEVTTSTSALVVDNDWGLYIWGNKTFTPGGAVTLSAGGASSTYGGDLKWASTTSVFDIESNALSIGGDWLNNASGTFTHGSTSTVTFTATQSGMSIAPGAQTFANLVFNGSGGTWSATTTTSTVNGTITMTAGTVNNAAGSANWTVTDSDVTGTSGVFNFTTSTFLIEQNGSSTRSFGATGAGWTFNNLTLRNVSTSSPSAIFDFVSGGGVTTTISNVLTFGNTNPLVQSTVVRFGTSTFDIAGAVSDPIVVNAPATVSFQSSTITYTGNNSGGNVNVLSGLQYWNVTFNNASETYVPTALLVGNDFTVNAGTADLTTGSPSITRDFFIATSGVATLNANTLLIGRNFTNLGTFNSASSTVAFNTSATSTILGSTTMNFWSFTSQVGNKTLVFGANQTFRVGGVLTIEGAPGNLISIDSTASGTQWLINHQGTESVRYVTVKDSGCVSTSTYISVTYADAIDRGNNGFCWAFPSLSFTISPISVSLALDNTNTYAANATNTLTVSTNASLGYNVTAYEDSLMTRVGSTSTIANWTGTNASPTTWTTSCIASATCGFGYSTNDADLTQFSSTKFAGFTTSTPGDIVATASASSSNDATIMTYRSSVDLSQAAGDYQATIRYIVTPKF